VGSTALKEDSKLPPIKARVRRIRHQLKRLREAFSERTERTRRKRRARRIWKKRYGNLKKFFEREGINPKSRLANAIEGIRSDEPQTRRNAIWALGRIGDPRTIPQPLPFLKDPKTRWETIEALERISLANIPEETKRIAEKAFIRLDPERRGLLLTAVLLGKIKTRRRNKEEYLRIIAGNAENMTIERIIEYLKLNQP
jgi:hypothetical protein